MKTGLFCGLCAIALILLACIVFYRPDLTQEERISATQKAELIEKAQSYFRVGEYRQAKNLYQSALKYAVADNDKKVEMRARYSIATIHWLSYPDDNPALAAKEFESIIDNDPSGEFAPWSKLALVRMKHLVKPNHTPDRDMLIKAYGEIYKDYLEHPAGHEALLYQTATLLTGLNEASYRKVRNVIENFIQKHPDSLYLSSFYSQLSTACNELQDYPASLDYYIKFLNAEDNSSSDFKRDRSNSYWHTATYAQYMVGDFATARKFYKLLKKEYPQDRRNFAASRAITEMKQFDQRKF